MLRSYTNRKNKEYESWFLFLHLFVLIPMGISFYLGFGFWVSLDLEILYQAFSIFTRRNFELEYWTFQAISYIKSFDIFNNITFCQPFLFLFYWGPSFNCFCVWIFRNFHLLFSRNYCFMVWLLLQHITPIGI